tara:strand:- start:35 stop:430 length:396 start_codon:yes stop_codon:yes gene_type:complete
MVLDDFIVGAVVTGDIDAVKAWLAADQSRDVNDFATFGSDMKFTLLAIAVISGVRACGGSWKSYCRLPHKQILRLRSLLSRGRARPRREPKLERDILEKRAAAAYRSIVFLCKLGDNGIVWKILEFWQATR